MERFTISLDDNLAAEFDRLIERRGYGNRSEAVRDLIRGLLEREREETETSGRKAGHCVASLSYVFNHHERVLAERLTRLQHGHHDLTVATMHAHLDHENCLEAAILRGPTAAVRSFADTLVAERGVRHGLLNLVSVDVDNGRDHHHGFMPRGKSHMHWRVRN